MVQHGQKFVRYLPCTDVTKKAAASAKIVLLNIFEGGANRDRLLIRPDGRSQSSFASEK